MMNKVLPLCFAIVLLFSGCGEKKADPAKIDQATALISQKEYEKGLALLDDMAKSSPNDPVLKKAQADAHMKYGNYLMYESTLPPKEKYPSALRQYRVVAAIDPTNAEAKQNISLIEGIYSQMGRPVPQ